MTTATIERFRPRSNRARARPRRRRAGPEARRRRLRVLDLHPQRHRHVLGAVRRLCGLVGQYRRRTDRAPSCSISAMSSSRRCVCCSRAIHAGSGRCPPSGGSRRASWSSPSSHSCSVRPFFSSRSRNLPAWWRRAPGPRAAPFCPPSSLWSARTASHVAGGLIWLIYHGGSGRRQGLATRRAAAPVVLEPVLARAGYRLGRGIHAGLSDGRCH